MKKALIVMGVLLVALSVMAPGPPEKAEKLKFDDYGWDYNPASNTLTVPLLCKFGIATAAEANGKFFVRTTLDIFDVIENTSDKVVQEREIVKLEGAEKIDGFIQINPNRISWNWDDDGSGDLVVDVTTELIGPSGQVMRSVSKVGAIVVPPTGCPAEGCPES